MFSNWQYLSKVNCSVTCMAAFVHHEDIRTNADHSTDVTLELSIWHSRGSSWHYVWIRGFPVDFDSLRSLLWTSFLYPLPSFIFSTATWVFITVQLDFNGVGYRGMRAKNKNALNKNVLTSMLPDLSKHSFTFHCLCDDNSAASVTKSQIDVFRWIKCNLNNTIFVNLWKHLTYHSNIIFI